MITKKELLTQLEALKIFPKNKLVRELQKQILGQTLQHSGVYTQDDNAIPEGWSWDVNGNPESLT